MIKLLLTKNYQGKISNMNNISDKNVIIIILLTIFFIFGLIFSVKSPERKVLESPIIWKDEYTQTYNSTFVNSIFYKI